MPSARTNGSSVDSSLLRTRKAPRTSARRSSCAGRRCAATPPGPTWARRLGIIRRFAQWLHGLDPQHEVPPPTVIPSGYRRARPYIYSDDDIRCIVQTAAALPSLNGLRALTCSTLFGLLAVTGLRISEA